MDLQRLVNASGFFLSSAVTVSLAVMFIEMISSNLVPFFDFWFILPLFLGSVLLRYTAWKRAYATSGSLVRIIASLMVLILGFVFLLSFLIYAMPQTITYYLQDYSGNLTLIAISMFWLAYSLSEYAALYNSFEKPVFRLVRLIIIPIFFVEASLIFLLNYSSYILSVSLFTLAALTALAGLGFMYDTTSIE